MPDSGAEREQTDIGDHDGHRLRLRRQISQDGFDSVRQTELLELMLCCVQPRQDVKNVCREMLDHFGGLNALLKAEPGDFDRFESLGEDGILWMDRVCALVRMCGRAGKDNEIRISNFSQLKNYAGRLISENRAPCCLQLLSSPDDFLMFQRKICDDLRWGESHVLAAAADDAFSAHARNVYLILFTDDPRAHPTAYDLESLRKYNLLLSHSRCSLRDVLFMNQETCLSLNQMHMIDSPDRRPFDQDSAAEDDLPLPEGGLIVHHV